MNRSLTTMISVLFTIVVFSTPTRAITLEGTYLTIQMDDSGSLERVMYNPTGIALPTDNENRPLAWGSFAMQNRGDFSMISAILGAGALQSYGGNLGNIYGAGTTGTSSGTTLSARTEMNFSFFTDRNTLPLIITQDLSFDRNGKALRFDLNFTNISGHGGAGDFAIGSPLTDMSYARAWSPAVYVNGLYDNGTTVHQSTGSEKTITGSLITAAPFIFEEGHHFDWQAGFFSETAGSTLGIWEGPSPQDQHLFINPLNIPVSTPDENDLSNTDYLTAVFDLDQIAAGETKSISFQYLFDGKEYDYRTLSSPAPIPEPGTRMLFGTGVILLAAFARKHPRIS